MAELTIIEGLKRLKLIEKRMSRNCSDIQRYAALLSNEKPYFDTEKGQRDEVEALLQSNLDLEREYCHLKARIDYTNLMVKVVIEDDERTIHGWLTVLRKTGRSLLETYGSLTEREANQRLHRFRNDKDSSTPAINRMYDENVKRNGQRKWEDLTSGRTIEGRLEVINATTQLMELP